MFFIYPYYYRCLKFFDFFLEFKATVYVQLTLFWLVFGDFGNSLIVCSYNF